MAYDAHLTREIGLVCDVVCGDRVTRRTFGITSPLAVIRVGSLIDSKDIWSTDRVAGATFVSSVLIMTIRSCSSSFTVMANETVAEGVGTVIRFDAQIQCGCYGITEVVAESTIAHIVIGVISRER